MLSKVSASKTTACFICGQEFPLADLTAHEKACLDYIKTNDEDNTQYTRQKSNDNSSNSSFPSTYNSSNLSNHSSSSGETTDKKHSRCYICGTDVPQYLSSIHEKNCKKSWETGLLNSICTPARKSKSKGDLSSLSRSNSKDNLLKVNGGGDHFTSTPNLTKSKSSTNIRQDIKDELDGRGSTRPRHLKSSNPRHSPDSKSKSTTNLSKAGLTTNSLSQSNGSNASRSSYDVRRNSDSSPHKKSDPQYVICQICGKLYSIHSISIHQRTCERTYKKQKDVGTNVEYKIKSKSLADLTKPNNSRPQSATPRAARTTTPVKTPPRPSSATPTSRLTKNSNISKSTGNIGPTYKRQLLTVKKDVVDEEKSSSSHAVENGINKTSPGLQKCYLCQQLYGTRSLPIHEKQCLKKWERAQKEAKKKKKKTPPKQDIQIMEFGRRKFEEDHDVEEDMKTFEKEAVTPSKLFGLPSPLKNKEEDHDNETLNDVPNQSENTPKEAKQSNTPSKGGPKFVHCVYCYKQFGQHSIAIHEKKCREKVNTEKQTKERIMSGNIDSKKPKNIGSKNLSKSVGDISLKDAYESHNDLLTLVKCDECLRKFLQSDIDKHRIHCRVSVL